MPYEITQPANDPDAKVADWLQRMGNHIAIIETNVGVGFQIRRARDLGTPSGNLGEIAVDEYATQFALSAPPTFIPLVLFEDPDVLQTRIVRLPRVHLPNTAAWIRALADGGIIPDGPELMNLISAQRKYPISIRSF